MKKSIGITLFAVIISIAAGIVAGPSIFAKDGEESHSQSSDNSSSKTSESGSRSGSDGSSDTSTQNNSGKNKNESHSKIENETKGESKGKHEEVKSADSTKPDPALRQEIERKKLDDKKKSVCDSREEKINTRINRISERSKNQFDRITNIYEATVAFSTKKGLTVDNYGSLTTSVVSAKNAAAATLETIQATPTFSCNSDGPKADVQSFLNARLDKSDAFKNYRDAVKVFVKAVKQAAESTTTTEDK